MKKIDRAKSLIRNNGVCMWNELPGDYCASCPMRLQKYCDNFVCNYTYSVVCKERKQLAEKYLEKKNVAIYDTSLNNVKSFTDLEIGDHYRDLSNDEIYIKIDCNTSIDLLNGCRNEIHMPFQIKVKKIKIKIEEIE